MTDFKKLKTPKPRMCTFRGQHPTVEIFMASIITHPYSGDLLK